jgi:limonene-1,2-epoxide hydrolase
MKRRSFVGTLGATALGAGALDAASAAPGGAAAAHPGRHRDYFEIYLNVIRAWKTHDAEAVLAHMADDIVWYVYVGQPPVVGKAAARETLAKLGPARHAENWRVFHHAVRGERLFVEGVDDFTDATDHRIAVPYAGVVEFKDGLITGWRDYFDAGILDKMKAGGPVPEAIEPLVSRKGLP